MVKYFGDAHHGQLMLQESNEVSFGGMNPMVGFLLAVSLTWLLVGSCLLRWKISAMANRLEAIRWPALADVVTLPDQDTAMTVEKHANRVVVLPKISDNRVWTLPPPKKGMWIRTIYGGDATNPAKSVTIKTHPGSFYAGGSTKGASSVYYGTGAYTKMIIANTSTMIDFWFFGTSDTTWILAGSSSVTAPLS